MNTRRWFALLLAAVMLLSVVNIGVFAEDIENTVSDEGGSAQNTEPQGEYIAPDNSDSSDENGDAALSSDAGDEAGQSSGNIDEAGQSSENIDETDKSSDERGETDETHEDTEEQPSSHEETDSQQEDEEEEPDASPAPTAPVLPEASPFISITVDRLYISAGERAVFNVRLDETVTEPMAMLNDDTLGTLEYSDISTISFIPNTSGLTGIVTLTVSGIDATGNPVFNSSSINLTNKYTVSFYDEHGPTDLYEGLDGVNTYYEGQNFSFHYKTMPTEPANYHCFKYFWSVNGGETEERIPDKDGVYTLTAPSGDLLLKREYAEPKTFNVYTDPSLPENTACDTLIFETFSAVYNQTEPYVLEIKQPEYKTDEQDIGLFTESDPEAETEIKPEYVYAMPMVQIQDRNGEWQDYFGFYLETVTDDAEYSKLWKLCIPGEDITGDVRITADKTEKYIDDTETSETDETTVVRHIGFVGSVDSTTEEYITELSVISNEALDASEERAKDYYFSLKKGVIPKNVEFSVDGGFPMELKPIEENKSIYKIEKEAINGNILVRISDPNVFQVIKQGSGKGEEVLIELTQDHASVNQDYIFNVKHHEKNLGTDLSITVTINGIDYVLGNENDLRFELNGDYLTVTIPAHMVIGDIVITARCNSEVSCSLIFEDSYYAAENYKSYRFKAFKIVLVTEKDGVVTRTLLDDYIRPDNRNISITIAPYTYLRFEVVSPSANASGKYYTDPNTSCYVYNFIGSQMGVRRLGTPYYFQDNSIYLLNSHSSQEYDGTFHTDYDVGQIDGDTVIKVKPYMFKFGVSVTGAGKDFIKLEKTYASYRSNFKFENTQPNYINIKGITVSGRQLILNSGYTVSGNVYTITGGYIKGDVVIVTDSKSAPEQPGSYEKEAVSSRGTEYELDIFSFRRLSNGYYIYMITAKGTPANEMHPCFDGHEMVYFEPYGSYVWLTLSNQTNEEFYRNMDDLFDELSADDLSTLRQNRIRSGKSTAEEEDALLNAIRSYIVMGDLNRDNVVDEKDAKIARELYINTDPASKLKSLGLLLLADVNYSRTLDMKDVAKIKRLAKDATSAADDRSFTLELSVDGKNRIVTEQDQEINVELKLIRTDKSKEEDTAISRIQDEIHFDGKLLELLDGCELAKGVEMFPSRTITDESGEDIQSIGILYIESEDAVKLGKETVLATFRFKVIDNDVTFDVSNNNAFVTAADGKTGYSCQFTDLTVESEKIQPPMYLVTFNYMGAAEDDVVEVVEGSLITAPLILPEYEGHIFAGWYADEEYTEPWDFENGVAEEDVTLYAKWDAVKTFNPLWFGVIAVALIAAGGAALLVYRRKFC